MAFQGKLADHLVDAGHEVHIFITELNPALAHFNGSSKAHKVTRFAADAKAMTELKHMQNPFSGATNTLLEGMYEMFQDLMSAHCRDLLESDHVIGSLRQERYDVIVAESMEHCMFGVAHAIGIPTIIGTTPVPMYSILARNLGIPSPSSFVP
ncbi:Protein UGT-49, partial [Aphelenchoides avenae]